MLPKAFLRSCTHTYTKIKLKFTNTHRQNHIHTKKEKHTKIQDIIYKQKQFQIDMGQRQSQLCYMESEQSELFSHTKSGQTCDHNRKIILIHLLIMFHMHITNRMESFW